MAVLLALCPLVVGTPGLTPPSAEEGTRAWVWQRLRDSGGGGVTEAVRVFETAPGPLLPPLPVDVSGGSGTPVEGDRQTREQDNNSVWERAATAADCYAFACETGVIRPDEMFLGDTPGDEGGGDADQDRGGQRSASGKKKRKASGRHGGDGGAGHSSGVASTPPRVLRSLAVIVERFGTFLREYPFQSLVAVEDCGRSAAGGSRRDTGASSETAREEGRSEKLVVPSLIIDDPGLLPTDRAAARLSRAVLVRRGFNLMATCLSKSARPAEMAALFVTVGLWTRDVHRLVVYSLAWPWAGTLLPRPSDGAEVESCEWKESVHLFFSETEQLVSTTVVVS